MNTAALIRSRCQESELADALTLGKSFGIGGIAEKNGKRWYMPEREWYQNLLKADQFIKVLCRDSVPFRLESASVRDYRDDSCCFLTGDTRITELYQHWSALIELVRIEKLANRIKPNAYMTAFLNAFSVCDELLGLIGKEPTSIPTVLAEKIIKALNDALKVMQSQTASTTFHYELSKSRRASNKNRQGLINYLTNKFEQHQQLLAVHLNLGYQLTHRDEIDFYTAKRHRIAMLNDSDSKSILDHKIGYVWKQEYGPLKGFHMHFLLLLDGESSNTETNIITELGEFWSKEITEEQGTYFTSHPFIKKPFNTTCMKNMINSSDDKIANLPEVINYFTKTNDLIRLELPHQEKSFGRGDVRQRSRPE